MKTLAGLCLAFSLAACSGMKLQSPVVFEKTAQAPVMSRYVAPQRAPSQVQASAAMAEGACNRQQQADCLELRALSVLMNPANSVVSGLGQFARNEQERYERTASKGGQVWDGYRAGTLQAASPKSFVVCMYAYKAPKNTMKSYRVNGKPSAQHGHEVQSSEFEEISTSICPQLDPMFGKVTADHAYRIRSSGADAIGASLQIPKSWIEKGKTRLVLCPEGEGIVYPTKGGLWVSPESLDWYIGRGTTRVLLPVVSQK